MLTETSGPILLVPSLSDRSAEVAITFGPSSLELAVSNPTRPDRGVAGPGHGIVGMQERAALLGGSLEAGASNGLFRIRARLPYDRHGG